MQADEQQTACLIEIVVQLKKEGRMELYQQLEAAAALVYLVPW